MSYYSNSSRLTDSYGNEMPKDLSENEVREWRARVRREMNVTVLREYNRKQNLFNHIYRITYGPGHPAHQRKCEHLLNYLYQIKEWQKYHLGNQGNCHRHRLQKSERRNRRPAVVVAVVLVTQTPAAVIVVAPILVIALIKIVERKITTRLLKNLSKKKQ